MTGKMFKTCAVGAAVAGLTVLPPLDAQAAVIYRTVALRGDAAPDTEFGSTFSVLYSPTLNAAGQVAFRADLSGSGLTDFSGTGIWSEGTGSLALVARGDDPAPGLEAGVLYRSFRNPVINDAGQVVFRGVFTVGREGVWSEGAGPLSLVAWEGALAPGTGPNVVFGDSFFPFLLPIVLNGIGQAAFNAGLLGEGVDSTNNRGIWSESGGSLSLIAREGDVAFGIGPDVLFSSVGNPLINSAGQLAFGAGFVGPGVDSTNNAGIWSGVPGSLALIVRRGDDAPGTGPDIIFDHFGFPLSLNAVGQLAFPGDLVGPGIDSTNDSGIWSQGGGALHMVVRKGNPAPDTESGTTFGFFRRPAFNQAGQTAFIAGLTGPGVDPSVNNRGIWLGENGSLDLITRTGDSAPGTAPGVVFSIFRDPVINGAGQLAFLGSLTGAGVGRFDYEGLWATDPNGILTLIARTGDLLDVNDDPLVDDLRTIRSIWFIDDTSSTNGEDGRGASFNGAGQIVFQLIFTDGSSGIFVATIPEPGSVAVLGVGVAMLLRRRG